MNALYEKNKDAAAFYLVYIREAHPEDGWQLPINKKEGIVFAQPKILEQRQEIAKICSSKLDLKFPTLVDHMDNRVERDYAGWPDRLYIVSKEGKIAYKGRPGPRGFDVKEMAAELEKLLKKK